MPSRVISNPARVFAFVNEHMPLSAVSGMQGLGLERDGELVAGMVFEGYNGHNIWCHVAAVPGRRWLNRDFLRAAFAYPFVQCGVSRLSGYVNASNLAARRFDEHLGFEQEAVLYGAGSDGGDVIIYKMLRENCRYA
jgi:RimJ/RimL family protein N-acetyltransferase